MEIQKCEKCCNSDHNESFMSSNIAKTIVTVKFFSQFRPIVNVLLIVQKSRSFSRKTFQHNETF